MPVVLIQPDHSHKELLKGFPRREPERLGEILAIARNDTERALLRTETLLT